MPGSKRRFGTVRQLPSGNWQVRYTGPDGIRRTDDDIYPDKTAALDRLVELEAEVLRGCWVDPDAARSGSPTTRRGGSRSVI